jgi:HSP20 family protein
MKQKYEPSGMGFSPLSGLAKLREEVDRFFQSRMAGMQGTDALKGPLLDVFEDPEKYTVKTELPGMSKEEIQVSFDANHLEISGERKQEDEGAIFRSERWFGKFRRTVEFPLGVDGTRISANYKDGVLCIYLPKKEEARGKIIEIKEDQEKPEKSTEKKVMRGGEIR